MNPVPAKNFLPTLTNSPRSIPVIIGLLMLPLFMAAVISWYFLDLIAGLGLGTTFSANYISTLKSIVGIFDSIVIFVFVIAFSIVVIRSFKLNAHPVLGIIGLIFLPVIVIAAAYTSNIFGVFTGLNFLSGALNQFPMTFAFFNNTALIAAGTGVLVLLVIVGGGMIRR